MPGLSVLSLLLVISIFRSNPIREPLSGTLEPVTASVIPFYVIKM